MYISVYKWQRKRFIEVVSDEDDDDDDDDAVTTTTTTTKAMPSGNVPKDNN